MGGPNGMMGGIGGMHPGMQHLGGMAHNDSYSLSQTQTINFTQQSLRRAGGPGMPMGAQAGGGAVPGSALSQQMTSQQMAAQQQQQQRLQQQAALDQQQKLLHQQQLLRAQQQQQQQYMAAAAAAGPARPPPPDYKAAAAHAMMQGVQRSDDEVQHVHAATATAATTAATATTAAATVAPKGDMSMSSLHMQQSQSLSVASQSLQSQQGLSDALCPPNSQNNFPNAADFGFEFLDSLGPGDAGAFTDQELLNSFDTDAGFNLDF
nr:unnamed protein product [Callosobruchus chinensis]